MPFADWFSRTANWSTTIICLGLGPPVFATSDGRTFNRKWPPNCSKRRPLMSMWSRPNRRTKVRGGHKDNSNCLILGQFYSICSISEIFEVGWVITKMASISGQFRVLCAISNKKNGIITPNRPQKKKKFPYTILLYFSLNYFIVFFFFLLKLSSKVGRRSIRRRWIMRTKRRHKSHNNSSRTNRNKGTVSRISSCITMRSVSQSQGIGGVGKYIFGTLHFGMFPPPPPPRETFFFKFSNSEIFKKVF